MKLLTLLTYADISAVNPSAMTPWRLEQLWKTYLIGYEEFTRELGTERIHSLPDLPPESAAVARRAPAAVSENTHARRKSPSMCSCFAKAMRSNWRA